MLQTLTIVLATTSTPAQVNLIDFGNNPLLRLRGLFQPDTHLLRRGKNKYRPHTAVAYGSAEKVTGTTGAADDISYGTTIWIIVGVKN